MGNLVFYLRSVSEAFTIGQTGRKWVAIGFASRCPGARRIFLSSLCFAIIPMMAGTVADSGEPWRRHSIHSGLAGADGVRAADVNGDGYMDLVTGWEEASRVIIYLNPGPKTVHRPWQRIEFGNMKDVEDAVLVDLDGDGAMDAVCCSEGDTRGIFIQWAPSSQASYADASKWRRETISAASGQQWMFCQPGFIGGPQRPGLNVGSKGDRATVAYLAPPVDPRRGNDWKLHKLSAAGWIMSIALEDMDGDGDQDVLISDRKGPQRGVRWLENPGVADLLQGAWESHVVGAANAGDSVKFLDIGDLDGDGLRDIVTASEHEGVIFLRRRNRAGSRWVSRSVLLPPAAGRGKGVAIGDVDLDGHLDVVVSCERAKDGKVGVWWIRGPVLSREPVGFVNISGAPGEKFDLVLLLDLDRDGDLDVITTEERDATFGTIRGMGRGLGVIWYENPTHQAARLPD